MKERIEMMAEFLGCSVDIAEQVVNILSSNEPNFRKAESIGELLPSLEMGGSQEWLTLYSSGKELGVGNNWWVWGE